MSKLSSDAVEAVFLDCLFRDGEPHPKAVVVDGIRNRFGFNPERIKKHADEINRFLDDLPEQFQDNRGGGWSFLQACMTKDGNQWGEHVHIEQLFALGQGIGKVQYCLPREMWQVCPGGMPYVVVLSEPKPVEAVAV